MGTPLSVSMALDALHEQCKIMAQADEEAARQRIIRNDLIYDALDAKIPYTRLERITHLSRDRLFKIYKSHPRYREDEQ